VPVKTILFMSAKGASHIDLKSVLIEFIVLRIVPDHIEEKLV